MAKIEVSDEVLAKKLGQRRVFAEKNTRKKCDRSSKVAGRRFLVD